MSVEGAQMLHKELTEVIRGLSTMLTELDILMIFGNGHMFII